SLSSSTNFRSSSSIFFRQSAMSISFLVFLSMGRSPILSCFCSQTTDEFRNPCRCPRAALFDDLHDRAADNCRIGKCSYTRKLLGVGDAEAHRNGKVSVGTNAVYQLLSVVGELLLRASDAGAGYRVNE